MTQEDNKLVQSFKINKLFITEELEGTEFMSITEKINVKNVVLYYKLADIFKISNLFEITLRYIHRCFTMVAETQNFLECNLILVKRILYSSQLHITSELEVFNASDAWIRHNTENRSKFAKDLLLFVRLPLLSDHALNYLLSNKDSMICKQDECKSIIQSVLLKKEKLAINRSTRNFTSRYCNQNLFDILICENSVDFESIIIVEKDIIKQISSYDFNNSKNLFSITDETICKTISLKGELYVFLDDFESIEIRKYSKVSKSWENGVVINHRCDFCACALIDSIYIIGGHVSDNLDEFIESCIQYDPKEGTQKEIAATNRYHAACEIFEGKIVVSGGYVEHDIYRPSSTNTVETYDHVADMWSNMPSMVSNRFSHVLVAIKSKLFVVGHRIMDCEVFDKFINKFVIIKSSSRLPAEVNAGTPKVGAVSIGNKIVVVGRKFKTAEIFDTETEEWHEEPCDFSKFYAAVNFNACCFKTPQL